MENYNKFWDWFKQNNNLLFNFEKDTENIFNLLKNELVKIDKNLTFEFGPVKNNKREFILSADGMKESFPEVDKLYEHKPELEQWIIIKYRQRQDLSKFEIKLNNVKYSPKDVHFLLVKDDPKVGILVFIKDYKREIHGNLVFLMLDMALGEYDMETKVGVIECFDFDSEYFSKASPFTELPETFDMICERNGIK